MYIVSPARRKMPLHMRNQLLAALTFGSCVAVIFFCQPVGAADSRLEAPNSLQRALTQLEAARDTGHCRQRPADRPHLASQCQTGLSSDVRLQSSSQSDGTYRD